MTPGQIAAQPRFVRGAAPGGIGRLLASSGEVMRAAAVSEEPEVYSARELARAAGRAVRDIETLMASGRVRLAGRDLVAHEEAVRVLRALKAARPVAVVGDRTPLFGSRTHTWSDRRMPFVASAAVHGALLGAGVLFSLLGPAHMEALTSDRVPPATLVFLARPGPDGGGGGGGLRQPRPAAAARREGHRESSSPVPPPAPKPAPAREEPRPQREPAVEAPVATAPADAETRPGVIEESHDEPSSGPGADSSAGTGTGAGVGSGEGAGIGDGSGGGTGGGAYRPGSGIEPPALLHEVKPDYSEDARRRSVTGDVLLEIVVRADGTVGDVRILQGLGYGLDQRAMDAVRQWRFSPARRHGAAVDVLVEVSVEFKLR